ncbi:uncharacterized protein LOC106713641 isoform X1 [Papilio machaon]|uniref:uncharacterized protein LOC106713641 isoform X1 n=1 Tax=Papilio machaon TaxID=76193 RepID=UPI001E662A2B|nr:uncharacterized protein LOC106713641 isoform X1 [Papilio machaon]
MESAVHAAVPLRVGKKMRKRRELDALVGGAGSRGGRLLSASSDEGEPWGRRSSRRRRTRPFLRLAAALALCVCVVSAATVLWLFVDVRRQIVSLRIEMDRVSTSSDSVGDALQVCHSAAKELRANATSLHERLTRLEGEHAELARRAQQTAVDLASVADQLAAAPKLADTPRRLAELQRTVGDIGSQINSFEGALNSARKLALTATTGVDEVKSSLHQLELRSNETIANVTSNAKKDDDLKEQVATLNATLLSKVNSLESRIEEINKPVNTSVPTPTSTSTSTTSSTTTTTTQTPGPPVKPPILRH